MIAADLTGSCSWLIDELLQMREKLLALMSQEIEEAVQSVLCDVEKHLVVEETHLNLQVCATALHLYRLVGQSHDVIVSRCVRRVSRWVWVPIRPATRR